MTVHITGGESVSIPLDDIRRIVFTDVSVGVDDPADLPAGARGFALLQNHPNPFTPSTTIEYELPAQADVRVRVFDVRGALVKELLHEAQGGGRHRVVWDGTDANLMPVASGMYVNAVECGGQTRIQRMILVR